MFVYKNLFFKLILSFVVLFTLLSSQSLFAQTKAVNNHISFNEPWVRAMPPMVMNTAGYVEVLNSSHVADKLVNVWSDAASLIEIHQTKHEDGVFKMLAVKNAKIPPKGKLIMQPGGYHLMMMGVSPDLANNKSITIHFEFEKAGIVQVNFPIIKK